MENGYVLLSRSLCEHWMIASDHDALAVFIYILLNARHKEGTAVIDGSIETLRPGELIGGRKRIAQATGLTEKQVRRILRLLEKGGITASRTANGRANGVGIISLVNWELYQTEVNYRANKGASRRAHEGPTKGQRRATNKNGNKRDILDVGDSDRYGDNGKVDTDSGESVYLTRKRRKLTGKRLETFNMFWDAFDYKVGKADAADAWLDIPNMTMALVHKIIAAARVEAARRVNVENPKMAQGWLSARRWEDELLSGSPPAATHRGYSEGKKKEAL